MEYVLFAVAVIAVAVRRREPAVLRCWNCQLPIPRTAHRCPHCGVIT
jgi:Zn finger protein HypA/HybF involved in hydrogenase expression